MKTDAELTQCDSLVVFFLTHGEQNDRLVARDETFHLYEFIEHFTPAALPAMAGKPKLFVVQACRGGRLDRGVQLQSLVSGLASTLVSRFRFDTGSFVGANLVGGRRYTCPVQDNRIFSYPEFADFLIAMSSHHGLFFDQESPKLLLNTEFPFRPCFIPECARKLVHPGAVQRHRELRSGRRVHTGYLDGHQQCRIETG